MYGDALRQLNQCLAVSDKLSRNFPALATDMAAAAHRIYLFP
jgi:hypothetical protein